MCCSMSIDCETILRRVHDDSSYDSTLALRTKGVIRRAEVTVNIHDVVALQINQVAANQRCVGVSSKLRERLKASHLVGTLVFAIYV